MEKPHILVVDDDQRLRDLLARYLDESGYRVTAVASAKEAEEHLEMIQFDLMILDVMMPGESGLDFARRFIAKGTQLPILLLTAMGTTESRIQGLEIGVDEYLPKPFDPKELLLRMRAILRRAQSMPMVEKASRYYIGQWIFNTRHGTLEKEGKSVILTATEISILKALLAKTGQVVTREELISQLDGTASARAIDVQITRIRRKMEDSSRQPNHIQTIRNQGYILWV